MSHLEPCDSSPNTSPRSTVATRRSLTPRATPPRRRRVISTSATRRRTIIPRQEAPAPPVPSAFFVPAPASEPSTSNPPAPPRFELGDFGDAPQNIFRTAGSLLGFLSEVVFTGLGLLKKPLIYIFYIYLFVVVLCYAFQFVAQSLYQLLSPICALPGASLLNVPICDFASASTGNGDDGNRIPQTDFPKLINLQASFEDILESSAGGSSMALDLKNSEVAVRDLSMLVRASKLVNRNELSEKLDDFVQTAKQTSRGLTRFGSRVNGVVDSLLAMDEFAIRSLENAQLSSTTTDSPPSIASAVSRIVLAPLHILVPHNQQKTQSSILKAFLQASTTMDTSIQRLILEAELVLRDLDDLENRLSTIQDMASREDSVLQEKHQEVLAELWSFLGGNRRKLANFASHRSLLANIATYRSRALAHVSASLIRLQQMQSDLEDLRDRVAQPAMLRDTQGEGETAGEIPLEVHVESIRKGVERLNRGRERVKGKENDYVRKILGQHDEAIKVLDAGR
ncbi:unnamed protein product [Tuber melanosporum]|uniref:(Perigord truffle) hypothetical protein n=1 Tax=Tuber melanosporum (strain Mel28) TaxID=656061 RepID=D5GKT4_TUBMM|nr:uncharacterized protein GSTUM_00009759001 [Tuber melanosporum]CAZ85127.1 unnamed protein product [Tuber melanosporum]